MKNFFIRFCALAVFATPALLQNNLMAQVTVNTVPFSASIPSPPHSSWSGNPVTLKGTLTSPNYPAHAFTYDWNPGDGGAHCTGNVTNQFVIGCAHTYTGLVGTTYTATLTITDTTASPNVSGSATYATELYAPPPNLPIEVNNAIDNGLWYLHSYMRHFTTAGGAQAGDWTGVGGYVDTNGAGGTGVNALNCGAFQNSGFLQPNPPTAAPSNPYADDVRLCLNGVFDQLTSIPIASVNDSVEGTFNPDSNGNGIGVEHNGYPENYQTGMMLDALVGTGTPTLTIPAGTALATSLAAASISGSGPGGAYTYKDAVADMVDDYAYCQAPSDGYSTGGWHYSCQETGGDNSVSQWAAIGIIPAIRTTGFSGELSVGAVPFGAKIPAELNKADEAWLGISFTQASANNGYFGYTSSSPLWGPYADTPSGLVQLALNGKGRGTTVGAVDLWDSAETFIRDNFGLNASVYGYDSLKGYYYGMFSFTKAMILHDNSGTGLGSDPISTLQSSDDPGTCAPPGVPVTAIGSGTGPCYPAIDWYAAQTSAYGGTDPTNGVARTIVNDQLADGAWYGQNYTSSQSYLQTGISITMLNKTVFKPVPVACFTITPNDVASGATVTLNGNCSSDQNPSNHLVSWEWDVDGTGGTNFTVSPANNADCLVKTSCSSIKLTFTAPNGATFPYSYPVRLRVVDNGGLTGDVVNDVTIAKPPFVINANAGGPYNFCPNKNNAGAFLSPAILDASKSSDPNAGQTDGTPGAPVSTILPSPNGYLWDFSGTGKFNTGTNSSGNGVQVNASSYYAALAPATGSTTIDANLLVVTNDNLAYPTENYPAPVIGTPSTYSPYVVGAATAVVTVHSATDEYCTGCVLSAYAKEKAPTPTIPGSIQLYWTDTSGLSGIAIDHYNIYRSTSSTFTPDVEIAGANSSPFLPAVQVSNPAGGLLTFQDFNVTLGTTYYYRVVPATRGDTETCQQGNLTIVASYTTKR